MDEKANVVEMDACADVGSDEGPHEKDDEEEERRVESDFSFDYEPDGSLFPDRGGDGDGDAVAGGGDEAARINTQTVFDVRVGVNGLEAFAPEDSTPQSPKPVKIKSGQPVGNRDETGTNTSSTLQSSSNRLGGADLRSFRSSLEAKRSSKDNAKDTLRQKLASIQNASTNLGGGMIQMMLILREENEAKAEARRADEEQRRCDELAAREERCKSEKKEAEERRLQESLEREEHVCRDREDARARTQELAMIFGALTMEP
ncbi:hypothetical protein PPTG_13188 [Phytophthora nicotianae INRA-310]|uniref:Uncharacterized protein n=1 Tax=Phytophthora nicotianae (strain INRA-310) TaxID=761204 RepID=W2PZY9_PHYN3|nr:hypothetical protein PPTG_13188 [Phytophthora nicotianae INRA-310]ETN05814.1 hypothetical protein PPTG_13188 [Phytophthora nicotianae INRA-310]